MPIEVIPVKAEHVPELGRICYEAFGALHDRHAIPRDFDSVDVACMVVGMMASRPDFVGFAAVEGGRLIGSNFIAFTDAVAGVGPITVDPASQSRGVGRALMRAVLDEAARRGVPMVRLMQEAVNATSLSLYTSLGFSWRDAAAIMQLKGGRDRDPGVRPMTERDLADVERLSTAQYGHSRVNEVAWALRNNWPTLVRERGGAKAGGGRVTGYLVPGFLGHGFAESDEDLVALLGEVEHATPPPFHKMLVPLSQPDLYRELLARGCRTKKVMNYMSVGPYEAPRGAWLPSIGN
jgi:GNAT superfamily N-acetyltransferase